MLEIQKFSKIIVANWKMNGSINFINSFVDNLTFKNISDQNLILKGKKVLLRVDLNVPMKNGAITESSRIEKIIPTIKLLIEKQAKIIILSHIGRPKGKIVQGMSLEPISKKLAHLLNKEVLFNKNTINENTLSEISKIPTVPS